MAASHASETIEIVTTKNRHTVLREGDPVWSNFLPDASIIRDDSEFHVSELVSKDLDAQWDAYNRFLTYLEGIAYVRFTTNHDITPQARWSLSTIIVRKAEKIVTVDNVERSITNLQAPTRRATLYVDPDHLDPEYAVESTMVYVTPSGSISLNGALYRYWCSTIRVMSGMSGVPGMSVAATDIDIIHYTFIPHVNPNELTYYDEIDRIVYILNVPENWQYWVPVRGVPPDRPSDLARDRRDRIEHTRRAGIFTRERAHMLGRGYSVNELTSRLPKSYYEDLVEGQRGDTIRGPEWTEDLKSYLYGAYHLASLSGFRDSSYVGMYDAAGFVWDDILYYMDLQGGSFLPPDRISTRSRIYVIASSLVLGPGPMAPTSASVPRSWIAVTGARVIASYPEDVDPVGIGLGRIVTGRYTKSEDIAVLTIQDGIRAYKVRARGYSAGHAPFLTDYPWKLSQSHTLAEFLYGLAPVAVPRLITSLRHWLRSEVDVKDKYRADAETLLAELEVTSGTPSPIFDLE